jgi:uncharacterized RDD family membrane protein YckC
MEETKLFQGEFNQIGKLWKRGVAYLIDGFVVMLPTLVIMFIYFLIISRGSFGDIFKSLQAGNTKQFIPLQLILWVLYLLYFVYFIGKTGQTPGKKEMGLKVVNSEGNIIGYKKAFFRYLCFILYGIGVVGNLIFIVSAIMGGVDKQKRTLHDRICKTFVVGRERERSIEKVIQNGKPRIAGPSIFALVLSIFCIFIPIVGQLICFYVCGRVLYDIKQSKGLLKGKTLAIAGIIVSIIYLIFYALLAFGVLFRR